MVDLLTGTSTVKMGHAQMLKGGVIMDVVNVEQAQIAAEAGAVAVMALDPASISKSGIAKKHAVDKRRVAYLVMHASADPINLFRTGGVLDEPAVDH